MIKIITGSAKGKKLTTLEGDATRPTSQRIKEAMRNTEELREGTK